MTAESQPFNIEELRGRVAMACREVAQSDTPGEIVEATIRTLLLSIRLIPTHPEYEEDRSLGRTRVGGLPDLPVGAEWPRFSSRSLDRPANWWRSENWEKCDGRPYSFLGQINLSEVAPFDIDGALPDSGLLSCFYIDPWYASDIMDDYDETALVQLNPSGDLRRCQSPSDLPAAQQYGSVTVVPRLEFTVPAPDDLISTSLTKERIYEHLNDWGELAETVSAAQGFGPTQGVNTVPQHRMLGYPQLIQAFGSPEDARLLLQIDNDCCYAGSYDTGMHWGDAGRAFFWLRPDDLRNHRLAVAWASSESC